MLNTLRMKAKANLKLINSQIHTHKMVIISLGLSINKSEDKQKDTLL